MSQHSISSLADSGTHYRVSWPVGSADRGPHAIVPVLVTGKRDTRPSDTSGRTLYPALGSVASIPDMTAGRKVLLKDSAVRMDFNLFAVAQKWIGEAVKSLLGRATGSGHGQRTDSRSVQRKTLQRARVPRVACALMALLSKAQHSYQS